MTLQSPSWLSHEDKYFVASRNNYNFRQISKRTLSDLLRTNFYHRQFDGHAYLSTFETRYQLGQRETLVEKSESKCSPDTMVSNRITHGNVELAVNLKCASRIIDVVRNDNELWMATFGSPPNYKFAKEGVVVVSLSGKIRARIDTGNYPTFGLALDPWTQDVWVVSQ